MWKQLQDVSIYAMMTTIMMDRKFPLSFKEVLIGTSVFVIITQLVLSAFPESSWKKRLETTLTMIVLGIGLYLVPRL
jgi:uncharacterized membrane protein YcjF (UPF0283 family)